MTMNEILAALKVLLSRVENEQCIHEETRRLGFIWTECTQCGEQWADDRGGFVPYKEPQYLIDAREALDCLEDLCNAKAPHSPRTGPRKRS